MLSLALSSRSELVPIEGLEFFREKSSRIVARRPIITTDPESGNSPSLGIPWSENAPLLRPI